MTPLRRKPKQLEEAPTLFQPGTGGNGTVLRDDGSRAAAKAKPSTAISGVTDEIDLDKTIEVLAERPFPEDEDIIGDCCRFS
jgi:hypothetical protein